jgi:ABC-2 type transport system permease protein
MTRHPFLYSAWVIGRRDFVATVWSRTYAFFLIGPLLIIGLSFLAGNLSERMARDEARPRVAVIASAADFAALSAARERLNPSFGERSLPDLVHKAPDYDIEAQTADLLAARDQRVVAVLSGSFDRPKLTGAFSETGRVQNQMRLILDELRQARALAAAGRPVPPVPLQLVRVEEAAGSVAAMRTVTARGAQLLLFMLTVFLSTMLLSNIVEEKSNKVIEVLAAAAPVDAIFLGKLIAMLAVSGVGILVWAAAVVAGLAAWPPEGGGLPAPAVGWPIFAVLVVLYYASNYLLLGALFLGIGSQASSVREVQTLSMPVTIGQMLVFFFAMFAVGAYNGLIGIAAAIFPFSSPLAMIARAAQTPELWTHAAALIWQAVWIALVLAAGASLFRRNVLRSGSGDAAPLRRRRRA